jgi:UDPglucose 6-dehydrogenase
LIYSADLGETINGADAAVVVTEWDEFRRCNWKAMAKTMANPLLIDLRNLFSLQDAKAFGVHYISLGRDQVGATI